MKLIKLIPLIFLLFIAGCYRSGPVTGKFYIPPKSYQIQDCYYGVVRSREYPGKYIIEYRCSHCGKFHTCEVSKDSYDKAIIGQKYYQSL